MRTIESILAIILASAVTAGGPALALAEAPHHVRRSAACKPEKAKPAKPEKKKKGKTTKTAPDKEDAIDEPAADPTADAPAPAPAAGAKEDEEGRSLQRGERVEFDARLIQGQTAKAGAVYLFARVPTNLKSMVRERTTFREKIVRTVYPDQEDAL